MKLLTITIALLLNLIMPATPTFREQQINYIRVRQAYQEKEKKILKNLKEHGIDMKAMQIYLQAFKAESKLELWAKNESDSAFQLVREFEICYAVGNIGPKRRQYDKQVPEGFYRIEKFNPTSKYYLSLGIDYPNASDRVLGSKGRLGGDIYIHGGCISSGCLPVTDDKMKELYLYCVEAVSAGQESIPVTMYPARLDDLKYKALMTKYAKDADKTGLWSDLKKGYDYFSANHNLPDVKFLKNGRHEVVAPVATGQ
jgi:murein L,D-transpeptidase YafK